MTPRAEGNRLYLGEVEVWEYNSGREGAPAHSQEILCVGSSPKGSRIVSIDKIGQLKVWDPSLSNTNQRIWEGRGFANAAAVSVTDDAKRLAVAVGLTVTVYELFLERVEGRQLAQKIEEKLLVCDKVASLRFTDSDRVVCSLGEVILRRKPIWEVEA